MHWLDQFTPSGCRNLVARASGFEIAALRIRAISRRDELLEIAGQLEDSAERLRLNVMEYGQHERPRRRAIAA